MIILLCVFLWQIQLMDFDIVCLLFIRMLYDSILHEKSRVKPFGFVRPSLVSLGEERNPAVYFKLKARGVCDRLKNAKKRQFIFMF